MFQRLVMGILLAAGLSAAQAQNAPPTVTLTSPATSSTYYTTGILTLSANAADSDGSIAKVEFYANGSVLLGTATAAPYTSPLPLTTVPPGTYSITAKATDNQGATTTSAAASITVAANTAPTVSITAPANNTSYAVAPASITITANAADSDGTIGKVEFYATQASGPYLIGSVSNPPYTITLNSVSTGSYSVTAKAYDNHDAITTSAPIAITVGNNAAPTVSITAPANNVTYSAPANLTINATASDSDGSLKRVEFYATIAGTTYQIGSITTPPYNLPLNNIGVGNYTVTARAVDNVDSFTVSAPITINVVNGAQVYDIHTDQIGTPRLITDQAGNKIWQWDNTDPFGNNVANDDPNNTGNHFEFNPRFAGQYSDRETNLHYNYYRDYDPNTGRYVQSDPIGLVGGINTYGYVAGNPISQTDREGLFVDEGGVFLVIPAAAASTATVVTAPAWAIPVAIGAAGVGIYLACHEDNQDKCKEKIAEVYRAIAEVEKRLADLYVDRYNLYNLARSAPSPSLPKGTGSWDGHQNAARDAKTWLGRAIKEALAAKCKVPPYAWELLKAPIPTRPALPIK